MSQPDYMSQEDGCRYWRECLTCPFPQCQYDVEVGTFLQWVSEMGLGAAGEPCQTGAEWRRP